MRVEEVARHGVATMTWGNSGREVVPFAGARDEFNERVVLFALVWRQRPSGLSAVSLDPFGRPIA